VTNFQLPYDICWLKQNGQVCALVVEAVSDAVLIFTSRKICIKTTFDFLSFWRELVDRLASYLAGRRRRPKFVKFENIFLFFVFGTACSNKAGYPCMGVPRSSLAVGIACSLFSNCSFFNKHITFCGVNFDHEGIQVTAVYCHRYGQTTLIDTDFVI